MKFVIFLLISTLTFGKVVIKDEVGLLSKQFVKEQESEYKDNNKEIHVIVKESIGGQNPVVLGAEYLQTNDLGGEYGSGIVILIVMDVKWIQVIIGNKIEENYTDTQINKILTKPLIENFKNNKVESGIENSILSSKYILSEVVQ